MSSAASQVSYDLEASEGELTKSAGRPAEGRAGLVLAVLAEALGRVLLGLLPGIGVVEGSLVAGGDALRVLVGVVLCVNRQQRRRKVSVVCTHETCCLKVAENSEC